jgi:hypothetical protein
LVTEREASGLHDDESLLDALIDAKRSGHLDETELRFMVLTVFLAGYDTSKNQLAMTMLLLLDRPEMYARCAEDKEFCGKVIQESLTRAFLPLMPVAKASTTDAVSKGELLVFFRCWPVAIAHVSGSLKFDRARNANRHLAFVAVPLLHGDVHCKDAASGRLHLIAQRLKNPRLRGCRSTSHGNHLPITRCSSGLALQ